MITPICPHTLTHRPVVDSAEKVYTIDVRRSPVEAALIVDGQQFFAVTEQHRITVRRAPVSFQLVKVPGRGYFQTLRDKLHWSVQPNFRTERVEPRKPS